MKAIAINGSPRKHGNTSLLIKEVFSVLNAEGIATEEISLAGKAIRGCMACMKCRENMDNKCVIKGDIVNEVIDKMIAADIIILASPTYFADVTPEIKALIDRAGFASGETLKRKIGAAVIAVRRGGAIHSFDTLNHFFFIKQMIVPGSCYWNVGIGRDIGDVLHDDEGMKTMRVLGENMAWLAKKTLA